MEKEKIKPDQVQIGDTIMHTNGTLEFDVDRIENPNNRKGSDMFAFIRKDGHKLYANSNKPLLKIVEDS